MSDIFERLIKNYGPIGQHRERAHGYFAFPKLEGEIGSKMKFRGQEMIVWSLNNYLGLANHPAVRKADADASAKYGLALPMGARMMSGNSDLHERLEGPNHILHLHRHRPYAPLGGWLNLDNYSNSIQSFPDL